MYTGSTRCLFSLLFFFRSEREVSHTEQQRWNEGVWSGGGGGGAKPESFT